MAVRKLRTSWWVDFRHDHTRYRKRSPDNSKTGAQAYEALLRRKLARGEPVDETSQQADKQKQLFKEFAKYWLKTYATSNNKPSEVRTKQYILKNSLVPFFGKIPLDKITTCNVEQFKAKQSTLGFANKTINNQLTVLSTCLHTAEEWFSLAKVPKIKKLKTPPLQDQFLNREETCKLLKQLQGTWREIVLVTLKTGLRMGELRSLQWCDINWDTRALIVRRAWCDRSKTDLAPKSNKQRVIPLCDEVYQLLLARKRTGGFVFTNDKSGRFDDERLNHEIRKACDRTGLQKITCHTLRHTFASHLAMAGAPIVAIQQLLGHSDIKTTMRYAHLSKSVLADAVGLLDSTKASPIFGQPVGNITNQKYKENYLINYATNETAIQ